MSLIISVNDVVRHFGGVKAVDGCSFSVESGKITAVIGPNGSGKSTLFHLISRIYDLKSGSVTVDGTSVGKLSAHKVAKQNISRTFQEVRLFSNLTIKDHLEIALSTKDESLFGSLFSSEKLSDPELKKYLSRVHLDKPLSTLVTDLSYGQRKLLDLAIALAKPHKVLMLDEPVAGVNPKLRSVIKDILLSLKKEGATVLVIEHDMNFLMDIADHVVVMDAGKVIAEGKPSEVQKNPKVLEAYLGA